MAPVSNGVEVVKAVVVDNAKGAGDNVHKEGDMADSVAVVDRALVSVQLAATGGVLRPVMVRVVAVVAGVGSAVLLTLAALALAALAGG